MNVTVTINYKDGREIEVSFTGVRSLDALKEMLSMPNVTSMVFVFCV